jgi:hypothetical protein
MMIDDAKLGRTSLLDALLPPLFTFLFCYAAMLKQETDRPGMFSSNKHAFSVGVSSFVNAWGSFSLATSSV